jgi:hypothetical protein
MELEYAELLDCDQWKAVRTAPGAIGCSDLSGNVNALSMDVRTMKIRDAGSPQFRPCCLQRVLSCCISSRKYRLLLCYSLHLFVVVES